jgi:hypothetical protein
VHVVVGHSDAVDASDAVAAVVASCQSQLAGDSPVAGLIFASIEYEHQALVTALEEAFPGVPLIGCTTDGEFTSSAGFFDDSLVLTLFVGEGVQARAAVALGLGADTAGAVAAAVAEARGERALPGLCITTPESMTADTAAVVRALSATLGDTACPIVGGTSGDHRSFDRTYQFCNGEVYSDSIPVLLFWGAFRVSHGVASGWRPVGPIHEVTSASGNVVAEIDGRPILEVFRDYWGEASLGVLGQFPLAVIDPDDADSFYLRAVFSMNPDDGSATFAAEVPRGAKVRITEVLRAGILEGSKHAIEEALRSFPGDEPSAALVFSCAARKWLLGTRAQEEAGILQSALPSGVPLFGFYCFGEIAPLRPAAEPRFHNETCVALLFGPG